jgi:hypothetical protein
MRNTVSGKQGEASMVDPETRRILEDHERRIIRLEESADKARNMPPVPQRGTESLFVELIREGFFREGRTMSQVRGALHAKGRIVKRTDLPPYLLKLVRSRQLKREKRTVGKREIWVYFT